MAWGEVALDITMWSPVMRRMLLSFSTVSPVPDLGAGPWGLGAAPAGDAAAGADGADGADGGDRAVPPRASMACWTSPRVIRPPMPVPVISDGSSPLSLI